MWRASPLVKPPMGAVLLEHRACVGIVKQDKVL